MWKASSTATTPEYRGVICSVSEFGPLQTCVSVTAATPVTGPGSRVLIALLAMTDTGSRLAWTVSIDTTINWGPPQAETRMIGPVNIGGILVSDDGSDPPYYAGTIARARARGGGGPIIAKTPWSSLDVQFALAEGVFGAAGRQRIADWLDGQSAYIDNPEFTRAFASRFPIAGVSVDDYSHRYVQSPDGDILGGVRFYNRDVRSPFVEVIAHTFTSLQLLRRRVRDEWSSFRPGFLRLRTAPEQLAGEPNTRLHKSIHVARYADLRPSGGQIMLEPFDDVDRAISIVDLRYRHLRVADPALGAILAPADPDELREWHDHGQLFGVRVQDQIVGVLAVVPSNVGWINGDEISEEVIDVRHNGRGYAAAAQCAWAEQIATDQDALLIGTIHGSNTASRKTAEAAGRIRVLDDYDVAL